MEPPEQVQYQRLRAIAEDIMARHEVWDVEVGASGVNVRTSPPIRHALATKVLIRQFDKGAETLAGELIAHSGPIVESAPLERSRRPDVIVLPEAALLGEGRYVSPEDVRLVAEVVSDSNPDNDYVEKTADYAAMWIPTYLIVDPRKSTVTVFSDPGPDLVGPQYRARRDAVFGDTVNAGPFTIRTSVFRPYD
ncbi:Uma2 family endonuclease [Spiractinospora alimapuensis]|uniref:Uma2 family endonuclease n=1 Tax=Spiractinospora alimapuensis TaxID=2820884 RepID=UPI001F17920C|nr:Uma2 family endonuclease [Spiractinospora alimapuensis]QVQ54417.1 Uma2 family endonuclease [Spiractinospora alimapuensis]